MLLYSRKRMVCFSHPEIVEVGRAVGLEADQEGKGELEEVGEMKPSRPDLTDWRLTSALCRGKYLAIYLNGQKK